MKVVPSFLPSRNVRIWIAPTDGFTRLVQRLRRLETETDEEEQGCCGEILHLVVVMESSVLTLFAFCETTSLASNTRFKQTRSRWHRYEQTKILSAALYVLSSATVRNS